MPNSVISGACPGNTPSCPSLPGMSTSTTVSRSSWRSGVTTTSWITSGSMARLNARLHLFGLGQHFFDGTDHVERLLRNLIVLAFDDLLEAPHGVFDLYVLALEAGELCRHEHWLRKELLDAPRARDRPLVFVGKFFNSEDGDNVLQVLVALQNRLDRARHGVMLLSNDARIENAREAGQRIDRGINAAFHNLPAQVRGGVEVREGCGRRGVRVI